MLVLGEDDEEEGDYTFAMMPPLGGSRLSNTMMVWAGMKRDGSINWVITMLY